MGLMDRVKAQATQLAQKTQEAAQEGKARLDQAQANRRGDALLRQLGVAVYQDRTGRGSPDSGTKIDQLISDLSAHERENGLNLGDQPTSTVPPQPTMPPESTVPPQSTVPPESYPGDPTADSPTGFPPESTGFPPESTGFPPESTPPEGS
jgi:hypothetical protein